MWDFLTKKCGIFGIEGGTKLWDFQHRGGDFRPLTSGHTVDYFHKIFLWQPQKKTKYLCLIDCLINLYSIQQQP